MADKLFAMSHGPVTRQDLRDELHSFAASALKQSLPDIANVVRQEVQQELRALLLDTPSNVQQNLQQQHQGIQAHHWQRPLLQQARPESRKVVCLDKGATLRDPEDLTKDGDVFEENVELRPMAMDVLTMEEQEKAAEMVSWNSQSSTVASGDSDVSALSAYCKRRASSFNQKYSSNKQILLCSPYNGPCHHRMAETRGEIRLPRTESNAAPETRIGKIVSSVTFNYISGFVVLANAISIGMQTDMMAKNVTTHVPEKFEILESIFCAVFTTELMLRIYVYGSMYFRRADRMWNVFDATLVLLQLGEQILGFFANVGVNKLMRILQILRLVRIVRMVRMLHLISELRALMASLAGSLRSLCWTVLLLMLIMYGTGVCLTQVVSDQRAARGVEFQDELIGSLGVTMLTLYQAITGGVSWKEIIDMPDVGGLSTMMVSLYVAFVVFALMHIVTVVFLESALANAKRDEDQFLTTISLKIFEQADKKASGIVTWKEFEECLAYDEVRMYFDAFGFDVEEAKKLFMLLDKERSGEVSLDDFILGSVRLRGPARAVDVAVIGRNWSDHAEMLYRRMDLLEQQQVETLSCRMRLDLLEREMADDGGCSDTEVHKPHEDGLLVDASEPHPLPPVIGSDVSFGPLPLPDTGMGTASSF